MRENRKIYSLLSPVSFSQPKPSTGKKKEGFILQQHSTVSSSRVFLPPSLLENQFVIHNIFFFLIFLTKGNASAFSRKGYCRPHAILEILPIGKIFFLHNKSHPARIYCAVTVGIVMTIQCGDGRSRLYSTASSFRSCRTCL